MARFRHLIAVLGALLPVTLLPCLGQRIDEPSIRLDPILAYEIGWPLALERTPGVVTWCDECSGDGIAYNHLVRFGASLDIPEFPLTSLDATTRLSLSFAAGKFTSDPFDKPIINSTDSVILAKRLFTVTSVVAAVGFDALFGGEVVNGWRLNIGPWFEYRILSRFVHSEEIISPLDVVFSETDTRSRVVAEGDLLGSSPLTGGLLVSTSRSIGLSDKLALVPELYARINASALALGLNFRSISGGIAFTFRMNQPSRRETFAIPMLPDIPSPTPPPAPPRPELSARIDLYTVDGTNTRENVGRLIPRKTLIRRHSSSDVNTVLHDYHAPQIGVAPEIVADAGVRWWGLSIRQGGMEIARITSDMPDRSLDLEVHLREGETPTPLTAELIVEDSAGAVAGARDRLEFIFDSTSSAGNEEIDYNVEEDWWIMVEPDGNFNTLSSKNERLIEEIVAVGSRNAEVILSPAHSAEALSSEFETAYEAVSRRLRAHGLAPQRSGSMPSSDIVSWSSQEISNQGVGLVVVVRRNLEK